MPFYPGWLIEMAALYPLDSLKRVQGIRIPALFILASKDFLMPNQVSENLFDHYAGPKRMLMFDSDHNGLFITAGVFAASQAFIDHLNAESPVDFRFDESRTVNATDIAGSSLIENWRKFVGLLRLGLQ
jgi:hypothetical protein